MISWNYFYAGNLFLINENQKYFRKLQLFKRKGTKQTLQSLRIGNKVQADKKLEC